MYFLLLQDILTQLRTIFDLIIQFQDIQNVMYGAVKFELLQRQNYEDTRTGSADKVRPCFETISWLWKYAHGSWLESF